MAFKKPKLPEYRESEGAGAGLKRLILFLKDFCMDCWVTTMGLKKQVDALGGALSDTTGDPPVTSVNGLKPDASGNVAACMMFENQTLSSVFKADNRFASYPYRGTLSISGIVPNRQIQFADVVFNAQDAAGGNFAPVCDVLMYYRSGNTYGVVIGVWAKTPPPEGSVITVPTVILW